MAERICTSICEQGITVVAILATLSMIMLTIVLAITDTSRSPPPKDATNLKNG